MGPHPARVTSASPGSSSSAPPRGPDRTATSPAWAFYGSTWVFLSGTGIVHAEPIEVELPRAGAGDGASVVILAPSGAWQPLPTTSAGGFLRAAGSGVPAPWVVAAAGPIAVALLPGLEPPRLADLDWLAFTNPAAWREEARARLEAYPRPMSPRKERRGPLDTFWHPTPLPASRHSTGFGRSSGVPRRPHPALNLPGGPPARCQEPGPGGGGAAPPRLRPLPRRRPRSPPRARPLVRQP